MKKLVVLGSVNADHILQVPHFPKPGETLLGSNYQIIPGGKGANQAVAAARLGANTTFIATVGDDLFGTFIVKEFIKDNIETKAIHSIANTPTGIAMIQIAQNGENSIAISAEANAHLTPEIVNQHQEIIASANYLLVQLETPIESVLTAIKIAKKNNTKVILNPAPGRELTKEFLSYVDIITPNETETKILTKIDVTDEESARKAANKFHSYGIKTVLITLGAQGVWYSEQNLAGKIYPGFKVDAKDTTAAGDTFNGALIAALLNGKDMVASIRFAHAAAAIAVTKIGAQSSIPTLIDVNLFLKNN